MDKLEEMMEMQAHLQEIMPPRHVHPAALRGQERADYICTHMLALQDELHEALRETPWKPWSQREFTSFHRDKYRDELVDAWHFFMNLLLVADISADEFFNEYLRKHQINRDRQDSGYVSPTG